MTLDESRLPGGCVIHPLDLGARPFEDEPDDVLSRIRARVADVGEDSADPVLVLDAALLGPRVPAERRVVEVLARADEVVAERFEADGLRRLVTVVFPGRPDPVTLCDAGARTTSVEPDHAPAGAPAHRTAGPTGAVVAFPPSDPATCATELGAALGLAVVLASRAATSTVTLARSPAVGSDDLARRATAALDVVGADAALLLPPTSTTTTDEGTAVLGALEWESHDGRGRYEAARRLFGLRPGTAEALEVGLPHATHDPVDERIDRACRLARLPLPEVDRWHPVRRHVRTHVVLDGVVMTVRQLGVLVEAPDEFVLGVAVGRLVLALAAEGVPATPVQHEIAMRDSTAVPTVLVAFLGDDRPA
ncbi:hypothetical protein [Mobilicoccus pelagius]|uniref:Uncharacterized protein n=1 Tax=Mobilicoccus pelagius NBRC 104925 TaxID=1089455 RepID=H5URU9_9MICO|nr:hypothetical protein [Mobilicoccus pelagius]GAB48457.1 hypothetical protein MOPEL_073_00980 [Mobilicoccus pelagius NBRC 104925]